MSTTVYGLKNCDTCKKATKWLDRFGVPYTFVDYRDAKPSPETLVEWAHKAGGFDALVGEGGGNLSGGQRQRIAIARVMLKDAPILILDEATSALDSEVETAIQENLFELMAGKTVIAIAHRLSTLTEMDRLVILDSGRIVETGSHAELVSHKGLYADLWSRQSGGFLADDEEEKEEAAE